MIMWMFLCASVYMIVQIVCLCVCKPTTAKAAFCSSWTASELFIIWQKAISKPPANKQQQQQKLLQLTFTSTHSQLVAEETYPYI